MRYSEDQFLQLSGLQHFAFCRRQWALIHLEQQWAENVRTVDGEIMHRNAHDSGFTESRGDRLIVRGVQIQSFRLGVSGQCDVLEYHMGTEGIPIKDRPGLWQPFPVEYKRGKPKEEDWDKLQLCGQALCLEEMLCCEIPVGALYYGEIRRRETVELSPELRQRVETMLAEMHQLYKKGTTPKVKPSKSCNACSLKELCVPKLLRKKSALAYIEAHMEGSDETPS